jgi:hypothetical protein
MDRLPYRAVWAADFEFTAPPGERPQPLCLVARELCSGAVVRLWLAAGAPLAPPLETGSDVLFVAYYASAELGCFRALGWPFPARILDLCAEFRNLTSGLTVPCGRGLLGALAYFGLDGLAAAEKESLRQLAQRGGPYTAGEREALLDYCQSDVDSLARLLPAMLPRIDFPRALLRGRYMAAAALMEWAGVPLDTDALARLRGGWECIKGRLIEKVDSDCRVFVPAGRREVNPHSRLGAALVQTAGEWGIDVHWLADAVDYLWQRKRDANRELADAIDKARKATGLTVSRMARWEDAGHDYSSWPGLDVTARELARELPGLGIGRGYDGEGGYDDTDYPGQLWERLREDCRLVRPKYDPGLLREAAELVASRPSVGGDYFSPMRFSAERFAVYLCRKGIAWPRLESGALALDDDTFREMARAYPEEVGPIRELRHALSQLRLNELTVGADGRNRYLLSAFGSKTGRNQPSNAKAIFGPSTWLRSLIRPGPGRAVAYVDWSAQELGIAAALSGDQAMQEAYRSGDPYLWLARRVGAVPPDATKRTHPGEREQFKVVSLGVLYGLSAEGLARRLSVPPCRGRELLRYHQEMFRRFWRWSDAVQDSAMLRGYLETAFGWRVHVGPDANPRSLRNFPMQANGAEMMRLACCLATERGIAVCCPVHDALLVEGPVEEIEAVVNGTQQAMREASELVLPGFPLRTDAKVVRHPERYVDERGRRMWDTVWGLLEAETTPITGDTLFLSPVIPPPLLFSSSNTYVPPDP